MEFEKALEQLETIVKELEAGELSLNESLDKFQKGISLVKTCNEQLENAEKKVEMLIENNDGLELKELEVKDAEVLLK